MGTTLQTAVVPQGCMPAVQGLGVACASPGKVPHAWLSPTMQAGRAQQHQDSAAALSSGDLEQIRIAALQKVKEEAAEVRSTPCCTCSPLCFLPASQEAWLAAKVHAPRPTR